MAPIWALFLWGNFHDANLYFFGCGHGNCGGVFYGRINWTGKVCGEYVGAYRTGATATISKKGENKCRG